MIEFASETIWSLAFLCWEILITVLVSSLVNCLFIFSISSWFSLGKLCLSSNLSISSRLSNLLVCDVTTVLWYFAFLSYHVSFYLSPLSFFLSLATGLFIFKKLSFCWFFSYCFSFHLFLFWSVFFPSLLTWDSVCSSFSSSLRNKRKLFI